MRKMTMEEVLARLKEKGIDLNDEKVRADWQRRMASKKGFVPPQIEMSRSVLKHMRKLIATQRDKDLQEIRRLREKLNRMKYGGGQ